MPTTIPGLEPIEELDYYDGPILFTADILGEVRLVTLIKSEKDAQVWMVSSPSAEMIEDVTSNRVPLRDACEVAPLYRVVMPHGDGDITIEEVEAWPKKMLPTPGVMLVFDGDPSP